MKMHQTNALSVRAYSELSDDDLIKVKVALGLDGIDNLYTEVDSRLLVHLRDIDTIYKATVIATSEYELIKEFEGKKLVKFSDSSAGSLSTEERNDLIAIREKISTPHDTNHLDDVHQVLKEKKLLVTNDYNNH